ncbi:MAG: hypothetical protein FWE68_00305, partial [Defluviitaleaceae bacterium]|nr:hypothetical protein [Defluviitaleaceae bacterium]
MKKRVLNTIFTAVMIFALVPAISPNTAALAATQGTGTISASEGTSMAIKTDGSLWAWGRNTSGELGDGTTTNSPAPVKVMDDVTAVSTGWSHTMAIKTDGSLWAWGHNEFGQLGDGTTTRRLAPVKVMDDVVAVSAGSNHTMAIKTDGSLWAWGCAFFGKLGEGTGNTAGFRVIPAKVMDGVSAVYAGYSYTMAIKTDSSLWAWGNNIGNNIMDSLDKRDIPVKVMDGVIAISVGGGNTATGLTAGNVVTLTRDEAYAMAIRTDGSLWAWGYNRWGKIGDGTASIYGGNGHLIENNHRRTPVKVMDGVAAVSAGYGHTLATKTDGSLWAWGSARNGQIGTGARYSWNQHYATPV